MKKILFLVYHGFSEVSGISKKIHGQVKGLTENGAAVDLGYYDFDEQGNRSWVIAGESVVSLGKGAIGKIRKRIDYCAFGAYIASKQYDLVYIRSYHNANPFSNHFVQQIKNSGAKVVVEIPTYPYDQEYQGWQSKPALWIDQLFRRQLMRAVDAVVTFSEDEKIFGQRAISISNGINFEAIPLRVQHSLYPQEVHLVAVAEIHFWHGFDRILQGLGLYYQDNPNIKVYVHIVGDYSGQREKEEIEQVITSFAIAPYVVLHGALYGDQLDALFDKADFAIGSLGRHRTGIARMRSLKNREYAARGISFAYAESDPDFDHQPYVIRFPADETAIPIAEILNFLKLNTVSPKEIRDSVKKLSWKGQMAVVLKQLFN